MINERDTKVGRIFNRLTDLPSLPKVVEKLLTLSVNSSSTREFADLIATDQGLSAKVLRLVNSAFYSLRAPVSSIRHASSLLGVRTLRSLVLSVSVINIFKKKLEFFDPVQFWRHALAVALAGPKIAERIGFAPKDEVYVAGLLHDIGVALLVQNYPEDYRRVTLPHSEGTPEGVARETEEFGQPHTEVGFRMATIWRLPALVAAGLRFHHSPAADLPADLDADSRRLTLILQGADAYARRAGYSFGEADRIDPSLPLEVPEALGLEAEEVESLMADLGGQLGELEGLYFEGQASSGPKARVSAN